MDIYREEIRREILNLSPIGRLLFASITCEKLYPNYVLFQTEMKWGNHEILQHAIILLYEIINKDGQFNEDLLKDIILEVDSITPDTEDFSSIITSFALDACTSIYSSLSYLIDNNIEHIVDVAIYARDTVDLFIQEKDDLSYNDKELELKIENDIFMISEKNRQLELIQKLKEIKSNVSTLSFESLRDKTPIIDFSLLK